MPTTIHEEDLRLYQEQNPGVTSYVHTFTSLVNVCGGSCGCPKESASVTDPVSPTPSSQEVEQMISMIAMMGLHYISCSCAMWPCFKSPEAGEKRAIGEAAEAGQFSHDIQDTKQL